MTPKIYKWPFHILYSYSKSIFKEWWNYLHCVRLVTYIWEKCVIFLIAV